MKKFTLLFFLLSACSAFSQITPSALHIGTADAPPELDLRRTVRDINAYPSTMNLITGMKLSTGFNSTSLLDIRSAICFASLFSKR